MTTIHLYDNLSGGATWAPAVAAGSPFTLAVPFVPLYPVAITALRWYRPALGAGVVPNHLSLWDVPTQTLVADPPVPDDGAVGWQEVTLATPITLVGGREYRVSQTIGTGIQIARLSAGSRGNPPYPLTFGGNTRAFAAGFAFPNSVDSADILGIDIETDSQGSSTVPGDTATTGDINNQLSGWLSASDGTHGDSAPLQDHTTLNALSATADGASGFSAIKAVADAVATSVGSGLGTAVSALTTAVGTANTALVHAATTWSDALATALQAMSDDFASFGSSKPAQGGGNFGSGTFPSNVGTLVWTLLDETDFVGSIAWAQPADVYVLSITTRPNGLPLNMTAGVHTIYRCGWWCPLNGTFARQRSYIDFEDSHLAIGAERMPGILISLLPGGEAHLQAWALA